VKPGFVVYAVVRKDETPAGPIYLWSDVFHTRQDARESVEESGNPYLSVRRATLTLFEK
jgi:hypothetical protein